MIVEQWDLSHILRESSGQLSTGIDITEKDIANGISGFTPSEPHVQDGRHVFLLPSKHQRAAGEEYEHNGFSCFEQFLQQRFLHVRHFQIGTGAALSTHLG